MFDLAAQITSLMALGPFAAVAAATGFTFSMTALGASFVYFIRDTHNQFMQSLTLGFAAGVMIAASIWSLLIPAIDAAEARGDIGWIPAAGGFVLGVAFLALLDKLLPHQHADSNTPEGPVCDLDKTTLLVFAVTLHNIPEGMSVGLTFAAAALTGDPLAYSAAAALAIGIGIQNIPEGTAVALPLKGCGFSANKSFVVGALSGIVEPIFGILTVAIVPFVSPYLPWLLAFAAGAMLYVVVEELIPAAHLNSHSDTGTLAVMTGFLLMMILDTSLG